MSEKPHYHGHRERLRRRVIERGAQSLSDYELLEFALFSAIPRGDVKPLAKALLKDFKSISGVLAAGGEELLKFPGLGESSVAILMVVQEFAGRTALEDISESTIITKWDKLLSYCRIKMGQEKVEQFRLIFLDKKNRLIADELQQKGTVDHAPVYVREVVKRALHHEATAVILVHNHPSGDPTPSQADVEMTREIQSALKAVDVNVHDHVIIARKGHTSFKSLGLI